MVGIPLWLPETAGAGVGWGALHFPSFPRQGGLLAEKFLLQHGEKGVLSLPPHQKPMGQSRLYQTPAVAALGLLGGAGPGSKAQDGLTQPRGDNFNLQPQD